MCFRIIVTLFLTFLIVTTAFPDDTKTYADTRKLLLSFSDAKDDSEVLADLFKKGDARVDDLIEALYDPDQKISLPAQIVIRYLGNEKGMKALEEYYGKQKQVMISGPIPLPLNEWDYSYIERDYARTPPRWDSLSERYIYALALDGSPRARLALNKMMNREYTGADELMPVQALKRVKASRPQKLLTGNNDLAKLVLKNAFFVSARGRSYTSAKLLGFNGEKNKALIEVYVNRGVLAEEWYHVVISKHGRGWKFFSITQVASS